MDPYVTREVSVDYLWAYLSEAEKSRILINSISLIPHIDTKLTLFLLPPTVEEVNRAYATNGRVAWFRRAQDDSLDIRIDQEEEGGVLITRMRLYGPEDLEGQTLDDISGHIDIISTGGLDVWEEFVELEDYEPLLEFDSVDLLTTYTVLKEREERLGLEHGTAVKRIDHLFYKLVEVDSDSEGNYVERDNDGENLAKLYANYVMFGKTLEKLAELIRVKYHIKRLTVDVLVDVWGIAGDSRIMEVIEGKIIDLLKDYIPGF